MREYLLQSRWMLEDKCLYYYGLRNRGNLFKNRIRISKKQRSIIEKLPSVLSEKEKAILGKLLGEQIVPREDIKKIPKSLDEATFCAECAANDYIIPGLEFDEDGRCPMCQTAEEVKELKSVVPILNDIPISKKSRFDVAVFYTGGKDSTFLLYHLAKRKGLRVLALTWEIPFMSESAQKSIENAKRCFPNVEFISRSVSRGDLNKIYKKLYELSENTCACPSLAYILFYPDLVSEKVPYIVAGNEPIQALGLYYNHIAPRLAYKFSDLRALSLLINAGRIITLRPPLKKGQLHTLLTMKQLAYGDNVFKKISGYSDTLVSNVVTAIHEVPELLPPLKRSIRRSSMSGNIPAFVQLDFDKLSGGSYDWEKTKDMLVKECGWVAPPNGQKALHTSCNIEKCKDYSQFIRFYYCRSKTIPFSAIEISLASRKCGKTREDIMSELQNELGFTLEPPAEYAAMRDFTEEHV